MTFAACLVIACRFLKLLSSFNYICRSFTFVFQGRSVTIQSMLEDGLKKVVPLGFEKFHTYQMKLVHHSGELLTSDVSLPVCTCVGFSKQVIQNIQFSIQLFGMFVQICFKWMLSYKLCKHIQCILDYPAMLGNLFPKSWPGKKSIYRRVPTVHHLHHT